MVLWSLTLLLLPLVHAALVHAVQRLVAHRFRKRMVIGLGLFAAAPVVWSAAGSAIARSAEPIRVSPEPGTIGEGMLIHRCDGPTGMAAHEVIFTSAPAALGLLLIGTAHASPRARAA